MANLQTTVSRTLLTSTALNSLGNGAYVSAGTITRTDDNTNDIVVEVTATPGTVASPKQLSVFAKVSLDGSNYTSGPESGTTATDEPNLYRLGFVPLATNSTAQTRVFSVAEAVRFVPQSVKIIIKNESGAALAATGHSVYYGEVKNPIQ